MAGKQVGVRLVVGELIAAGLLAAAALAVASPADAGLSPVDAEIAVNKLGPYQDPTVTRNIAPGDKKSFHVRVTNTTGPRQSVTLFALLNGTEEYKEKYFKGGQDITELVDGAGYEFGLGSGRTKHFRLQVKLKDVEVIGGRCVTSQFDPGDAAPDNDDLVFLELNGVCA